MSSEEQEPQDADTPKPEEELSPTSDNGVKNSYDSKIEANIVAQGDSTSVVSNDDHSMKIYNIHLGGNVGGYAGLEHIAERFKHGTSQDATQSTNKDEKVVLDIIEALQNQQSSKIDMDDTNYQSSAGIPNLEAPEDIAAWFYKLSEIQQDTVKAVAILHGGKTQEIIQLRTEIYHLAGNLSEIQGPQTTEEATQPSLFSQSVDSIEASSKLFENTYTVFRKVNEVERIFWNDANEYGYSAFNIHVCSFFAQEALRGSWGTKGKLFIDAALRWIDSSKGDAFWRASQATGIIWRSQDPEELQRLANKWASSTNQKSWRRAASLLNGAYEFECSDPTKKAEKKPRVRFILDQWVNRAHTYSNAQVGCAAAYTYGLIGKSYPEQALQGLDTLLQFPPNKAKNNSVGIPENIFIASIANYMSLVWSGHLRHLLAYTAKRIEELVHWRVIPKANDLVRYRTQRIITLETLFSVFFLITALSTPDKPGEFSWDILLPTKPQVPDPNGRDIILIGALNKREEGWRSSVAKILCAAIIANKSEDVFLLLKQWTAQILSQKQDENTELHDNFIQFFIRMDNMLQKWDDDLTQTGFHDQHAKAVYRKRLIIWSKQHNQAGYFACEVLQYLTR